MATSCTYLHNEFNSSDAGEKYEPIGTCTPALHYPGDSSSYSSGTAIFPDVDCEYGAAVVETCDEESAQPVQKDFNVPGNVAPQFVA